MASVTSLGLHHPTALPYLIQERLLPQDPATDSYTWQTLANIDEDTSGDDELVVTKTCVVWCRGGIVRKSFRFEIEGETVIQAILTNFPPDHNKELKGRRKHGDTMRSSDSDATSPSTMREEPAKSRALVVFLRTQAHIYFLSGTSHVVHLPFEVEHAFATHNGLILQRKLQTEKLAPVSLKLPRVPPNSFITSQPQPWSASSSIQSTFSIASLGSPQQLSLPPTALLGELWKSPTLKDDSHWPRLFTLTDPLAELGLIVTAAKTSGHRRSSLRATAMEPAEEVVHVTSPRDFPGIDPSGEEFTLAVTLNRETSMYTVWSMRYISQEESFMGKPAKPNGAKPRRRSSFMPGTGATTPVPNSQHTFRESFGGAGAGLNKLGKRREEAAAEPKLDFVASLDPDSEVNAIPRRKSRRVSSMLARGDLSASASHDRPGYSELSAGQQPHSRADSIGGQNGRASFGYHKGFKNSTSSQAPPNASINSFLEAPVDDLLQELKAGGDFEGFHNMDLEDDDFEGLKKEIVFTKIDSVSAEHSNLRYSTKHKSAQSQCRVFTLAAPSDSTQKSQIVTCILDPQEKKFIVITLNTAKNKKIRPSRVRNSKTQQNETFKEPLAVTWRDVVRADHVIDACKVFDGDIARILVLSETADGFGELTLQSPWGLLMKISLPTSLVVNNIRSLGYDAHPRKRREGSLKRILSKGPRAICGIRNPLPGGIVDILDEEGRLHQLHVQMEPRLSLVKQAIDVCKYVLTGKTGDSILVGWWNARQWLDGHSDNRREGEWTALVVTLFALVLSFQDVRAHPVAGQDRRSRSSLLRSGSTAASDTKDLEDMLSYESFLGNPHPAWMLTSGWEWLSEEHNASAISPRQSVASPSKPFNDENAFIQRHINLAREFMNTTVGEAAIGVDGYLPTATGQPLDMRKSAISQIISGLHLLHEDQKLDITLVDSLTIGNASLAPVLSQMCKWIGWNEWATCYDIEDAAMDSVVFDSCRPPL